MLLGFAITQHCNLRCPHCIRDDVTTVRNLPLSLIRESVDGALSRFGEVAVSLTGGEPLLHPQFGEMAALFAERGVRYRFVSNGWHMGRTMPVLDRYPPSWVRLSLSGASEATHDAVRGRGSFVRVLRAVAMLTSRRIPTSFSMVIDRAGYAELEHAVDLADMMGVLGITFILPQPVTGSLEADSELPPQMWARVRDEVAALAARPSLRTAVAMDYGAPFAGPELPCETFAERRVYIDAHGRMATCCQLSDYGFNETEVVADLNVTPFAEAYELYLERLEGLRQASRPTGDDPLDPYPCMRCVKASGKLDWLQGYAGSGWGRLLAAGPRGRVLPVLR